MATCGVGVEGEHAPLWLESVDLSTRASPPEETVALIADLDDPGWAEMTRLPPSPQDLADERRPGAAKREYFLHRRALTRSLVALHSKVRPDEARIAYDLHGAPRVLSPPERFVSVAARGPLAAIAVSRRPVGVDLEPLGPAHEPVWHVLHEHERQSLEALESAERHERFLRIWTMKEAYLKALGLGFERDPSRIQISVRDGATRVLDAGAPAPTRSASWKTRGSWLLACFVGM
ncbi:MAG TPA: 4'-phosphopantetheinyl transferase superfamily protein [Beijerinckiaceae bacterium]|nr:4'-phosphopantetheinyl transferase superfamily protein [Beijerinckiaceae bacterium]